MDLGIDRLIELIEERFGKRTSNTMLVMVVLAVFVFAADIVLRRAILPLAKFFSGLGWQATQKEIIVNLFSFGISILLAFLALNIVHRFLFKRVKKTHEEAKVFMNEIESKHSNMVERFSDLKQLVLTIVEKTKEALVKTGTHEEEIREMEKLRNQLLGIREEPIEPQASDTEDSPSQ